MSFVFVTGDIYDIYIFFFFFFGNGLIDDVIVIGWTDSDFKISRALLQTILKAHVKFQKDRTKTVGGVKGTRYLLKIRNHAPRKVENSVPLFFEKAENNKNHIFNFYNLLKMNGVFRTCSHKSVHSNFLDYHKQAGTFYAYFT